MLDSCPFPVGSRGAGSAAPAATAAALAADGVLSAPVSLGAPLLAAVGVVPDTVLQGSNAWSEAAPLSSPIATMPAGSVVTAGTVTTLPTGGADTQQVLGNDVAELAAALAQEKIAAIEQLEALQQQLREEVMSLLPLI